MFQNASWHVYKNYIKIHPSAIIDPCASVKIFNLPEPPEICIEIDEGSHIFSNFGIVRSSGKIMIGKRCQLGNSYFNCAESIEVGNDVLMAWGITLIDHDSHALQWEFRKNDVTQAYHDYLVDRNNFIKNKDWSHVDMKPIIISDRVWIGFNVTILKGVTVGEGSVIGACSVVTRDVPPNCVFAGNPAKLIKEIEQ
jgi:galactoside O-acetyltransferase